MFDKTRFAKIPILLILWDILSILFANYIIKFFYSSNNLPPEQFIFRLIILALFLLVQLIFNTYQPNSEDLRINFVGRQLIASGSFLIIASAVLFTTEFRYLGGAWGRGYLFTQVIFVILSGFVSRNAVKIYKKRILQNTKVNILLILKDSKLPSVINEIKIPLENLTFYYYQGKSKISEPLDRKKLANVIPIATEKKLKTLLFGEKSISFGIVVLDSEIFLSRQLIKELMVARIKGLKVMDTTDFIEYYAEKIPVLHLKEGWILLSSGFSIISDNVSIRLKGVVDFFIAAIIFLPCLFLILLFGGLVKLSSKGSLLYRQTRVGRAGQLFTIFKIRSMTFDAEKSGAQWASESDPRITKIGNFIRKTRIDELPQIFNILKGEMSFIGPRPERPEFVQALSEKIPFFELRHLVKPGISGWAQVNYPYGASFEDSRVKLEYDLFYIKNYSLILDARIIVKTLRVVLFGKGR